MSAPEPSSEVIAELAPTRELRAGINVANFLLVTGETDDGRPVGVSPDVAGEVARRLDVPLRLVSYPSPGHVADAATADEWDIGNIGAEPQRAETIAFTAAYCEIAATYLVPAGSGLQTMDDVDQPGLRIAVYGRAAYGLYLHNHIRHATLVEGDSIPDSFEVFVSEKCDALAGLKPRLLDDVERLPGARILPGQFSAVQQAIGTPRSNTAGARWLGAVVEELKANGFVADAIARHGVKGLTVAPLAAR